MINKRLINAVKCAIFFYFKAGCKAVVMVDEFRTENFYDTMTRLIPELPHAKPGELQSER